MLHKIENLFLYADFYNVSVANVIPCWKNRPLRADCFYEGEAPSPMLCILLLSSVCKYFILEVKIWRHVSDNAKYNVLYDVKL